MYGKIFDSIYDGTLRADWQALVTFQQLIILCNADGIVDMTPHAVHGRTGIPLDIIEHGIKILSEPDPQSRSSTEEGRRIVLIDTSRTWGWRLVNHTYYRNLISREDKKEKDRVRMAEKRSKESDTSQSVANGREASPRVENVAHTYTEANTNNSCASKNNAREGFERFWFTYPKKKSKGSAEKAWKKIKPSEQLQDRILRALEIAKTSQDWTKDNGKWVPYPASWLNAKGWEDEIETKRRSEFSGGV